MMSEPTDAAPANTLSGEKPLGRRLVMIGLALALICAAVAVLSGIGYRLGLWHFRTGFDILKVAFYGGWAAAAVSLAGLIVSRARPASLLVMGLLGVLVAAVTAYIPWTYSNMARSAPRIHDITTNIAHPPPFVAAAKLRKPGDHPVDYDGPEIGAEQTEAYPDIEAVVTKAPKDKVFVAANQAVSSMGLEIIDTNPGEGRIEAVDTSLLYGFKDDMVVQVQETPEGTRIDVRSMSRVGRSDLGMNAKRIRTFLARLRSNLPPQ
jgi:uncharacterized protein (DUF1499 family)